MIFISVFPTNNHRSSLLYLSLSSDLVLVLRINIIVYEYVYVHTFLCYAGLPEKWRIKRAHNKAFRRHFLNNPPKRKEGNFFFPFPFLPLFDAKGPNARPNHIFSPFIQKKKQERRKNGSFPCLHSIIIILGSHSVSAFSIGILIKLESTLQRIQELKLYIHDTFLLNSRSFY